MDDLQVPSPSQKPILTLSPQLSPTSDSVVLPDAENLARPSIGLTVIHEPPDAVVDILVTHGLMGDAFRTFYHAAQKVYWLRAFLMHDIANARIMVFGYDVAVWHPWNQVSQGWLSGYAADLLGSLSGCRNDERKRTRPILFIAHSLGGLVVQQALTAARDSRADYLRDIETHTIGICFLGTPHRGANLATWGERFARMFNIFKPVNYQIVSLLEPRSKALHEMRRAFYNLLEKRKDEGSRIQIVCFYETVPMMRSLIVSEDSATIDGEPCFPIFANHVDMAKFGTRQDSGYMSILRELQRMMSDRSSEHLCPGCRKYWKTS
ncbi:hypothetical protein BDW72DRAFT_197586 [Aspergillus terricola var. indicus]